MILEFTPECALLNEEINNMLLVLSKSKRILVTIFAFMICLFTILLPISVSELNLYWLKYSLPVGDYSKNNYSALTSYPYSVYYVSKTGNNLDGKSWTNAWNELDQIDWSVIHPGDTIQIDGGTTEMIYTSTLEVKKSGLPSLPIRIKLSNQKNRNGQVVIFGGRSIQLPYCDQLDYIFQTDGIRQDGIILDNVSWVIIDGLKWSGITIYGHNQDGIKLAHSPNNIIVRNTEIYDNGWANISDQKWFPDGFGVELTGANITFERVLVHDNGQDAFTSSGGNDKFSLRQSWLYNSRVHPIGGISFNYCTHSDGIQIFDGGIQFGLVIENSIIGPGFTQGVILGQSLTTRGQWASINNVFIRNVIFIKAEGNNVLGYPGMSSEDWVLDHVTIHCPNTSAQCLYIEGSGHQVIDTIIYDGRIDFPDGLSYYNGNCQWNTTGFTLGKIVDPLFANISSDPFSLDDYSLLPTSPCEGKGSQLTSVDQLLKMQNSIDQLQLPSCNSSMHFPLRCIGNFLH
jgi:hypothetical protein